jgi:isoleucyl-tRNA synthetase
VPVDLYLEGSDQHRGWFQLSLLPALGAIGSAPFQSVLTHGFTVDEKGMKQSKSLGNYVNAQDEVAKYGADILRLWVASVNYQEDVRCTDELIGRSQDAYRKIRNTLRYLLSNINDFDPKKDAVPYERMHEIDQWAMQELQKLIAEVTEAYEGFVFHRVFSLLYNFCSVQMSSIYMDVLKDRMYCDATDSPSRRSGQTAMYHVLGALVRLFAPVLVHTMEEAWSAMTHKPEDGASVHVAHLPKVDPAINYADQVPKWAHLMNLRDEALRALEGLRRDKVIASNQEASITMRCTPRCRRPEGIARSFAALCIVSEVKLEAPSKRPLRLKRALSQVPTMLELLSSVGKDASTPVSANGASCRRWKESWRWAGERRSAASCLNAPRPWRNLLERNVPEVCRGLRLRLARPLWSASRATTHCGRP